MNKKQLIIGIDPSINSTGICLNFSNSKYIYYIITSKQTKKIVEFSINKGPENNIYIKFYNKQDYNNIEYNQKEHCKTNNLISICEYIKDIIKKYKYQYEIICNMEGISYGSTGSAALIDLSGLNFMIRQMFIQENIQYNIISPTQNKKFATGNGQAEKDVMIDSWLRLEPNLKNLSIKIDDLADAYFLSNYPLE